MSSVVISGDTSGAITLAAPAIAGTNTLTLPANTGTVITTASSGQSIPKAALPTGSVLQVVQTVKTDTASANPVSAYADISGMSASITPTSASSKILAMFTLNFSAYAALGNGQAIAFRLVRDSTAIFIGDSAGSRTRGFTSIRNYDQMRFDMLSTTGIYLDSPNTTSSTTYKMQWFKPFDLDGNSNIIYLNRSYEDNDSSQRVRGASSIILMEIAA